MKKLVFIHTTTAVINELNLAIKKRLGNIIIENLMDDTLSNLLKKDRGEALQRLNTYIKLAQGDNAQEDVKIVLTCTALSDLCEETMREIDVIDGYLHKAVSTCKDILLVATSKDAFLPTRKGILKYARNQKPIIDEVFVEKARENLQKGDKSLHDKLILNFTCKETEGKRYDAIILCQPSMAHVKDTLQEMCNIPVLTGMEYFINNFKLD